MTSKPSSRQRPQATTLDVTVVAPRCCACPGCNFCGRKRGAAHGEPLTYAGRGAPPKYCPPCQEGGAARFNYEGLLGEGELRTIRRIDQANHRARSTRMARFVSDTLQRFGGLKALESRVVSGDWPEQSWGELRPCLESIVADHFQRQELVLAAPFVGVLHDLYRAEGSSLAAQHLAKRTTDRFHVAVRKKSTPALYRFWELHFHTLTVRMCLEPRTYAPDAIPRNIAKLRDVIRDESLLPFVRSEARVELAGQLVKVGADAPEIMQHLKDLRDKLDDTYAGPNAEWILAAARLRPQIGYALQQRPRPRGLRELIHQYGQIVLPEESFSHASLYAEWRRAIGEPIDLVLPALKLNLVVPPIGIDVTRFR